MAYFIEGSCRTATVIAPEGAIMAILTYEELNKLQGFAGDLKAKLIHFLAKKSLRKLKFNLTKTDNEDKKENKKDVPATPRVMKQETLLAIRLKGQEKHCRRVPAGETIRQRRAREEEERKQLLQSQRIKLSNLAKREIELKAELTETIASAKLAKTEAAALLEVLKTVLVSFNLLMFYLCLYI